MSDTEEDLLRTHHPRVLVVAHQTATSAGLLEAVRQRAELGEASFHLLVPEQPHDLQKDAASQKTEAQEAQHVLGVALPKLSEETGTQVTGSIGDADPWVAIRDADRVEDYDEIIISTLPLGHSRWLGLDVVSRVRNILGKPVTHVEAPRKVKPR